MDSPEDRAARALLCDVSGDVPRVIETPAMRASARTDATRHGRFADPTRPVALPTFGDHEQVAYRGAVLYATAGAKAAHHAAWALLQRTETLDPAETARVLGQLNLSMKMIQELEARVAATAHFAPRDVAEALRLAASAIDASTAAVGWMEGALARLREEGGR